MELTAAALLDELRAQARPDEFPLRHYHGDGGVLGVRMGTTFEISKRFTDLPLTEVDRLLDVAQYEAQDGRLLRAGLQGPQGEAARRRPPGGVRAVPATP